MFMKMTRIVYFVLGMWMYNQKRSQKQESYLLASIFSLYDKSRSNNSYQISTKHSVVCVHSGWLFQKLKNYDNHIRLLKIICCNRYDEQWLSYLYYKYFDDDRKTIHFKKWVIQKQDYRDPKTNRMRSVTKYIKKKQVVYPRELIKELEYYLEPFNNHERNIVHQYEAVKNILRK